MQFSISRPGSRWFDDYPHLRKDTLMQVFGSEVREIRLHATSEPENKAIRGMARILKKVLSSSAVRVEISEDGHFSNLVLFFIND